MSATIVAEEQRAAQGETDRMVELERRALELAEQQISGGGGSGIRFVAGETKKGVINTLYFFICLRICFCNFFRQCG